MTAQLLDRPAGLSDADRAEIVDSLTRREFLTEGAALGALGLGLAACGSSSTHAASTARPSARMVDTIHGPVWVPADPRRVVALDFPEACALLDLGIIPVGKPNYMPNFGSYTAALRHVEVVGDATGKPVLEKVAALRPDLIVTDDWQESAGNWPGLAAETANAVNRVTKMSDLKRRYLAKAAAINRTYGHLFARTRWDLIDDEGQLDLYGPSAAQCAVLTWAGVRLGAGSKVTTGFKQYSLEDLDLLDHSQVIVTQPASLALLDNLTSICKQLQGGKS